ncbi:MAG: thiol-activated cytolysin family protein [Saprospiraceae bacterium]|nr:thiol-activated cytolysin family protein [Saprospiraceae bacterium]
MKQLLTASMFLIVFISCSKEDGGIPTDSFETVIAGGGEFDAVTESNELLGTSSEDEVVDGEYWRCSTETYEANYAGGGDEGFPQFNPNASVVYPGNLLQGKTLQKATPSVISVPRAGGTISIDIFDGSSQSYFDVEEVSKSAIGQAANNIIAGSTGAIPANMDFSYETVYSREQLALSLGVDYNTAFTSIESKLSFSSDKSYNRTIVKLNQSYYTLSFDLPTSYDDLFDPSVTPEQLAKYVQPDNPVTYISDVVYGRIYYLLVETTSSREEMEAAISASFSGAVTGGGAEADVNSLSQLSNMKIKLFAFGGESSSTLLTIADPGNLEELAYLLAESTDIRTGKPISYVVRSALSNEIVSVSLNTQYDVTTCEALNPNGPPLPYMTQWPGIYNTLGPVGAGFSVNGTTTFYLFNEAGDQYVITTPEEVQGPFPLSELGDGTCPLSNIGAAAHIESNNLTGTIMLFDEKGINFTYMYLDTGKFLGSEPISNWGDPYIGGDCPFKLTGVSALLNYNVEANATDPNYVTDIRMAFENNSQQYAMFSRRDNKFASPKHLDGFVLTEDFPFEGGVNAALGFQLNNERYQLMFNEEGTKYVVVQPTWGGGTYLGPFGI